MSRTHQPFVEGPGPSEFILPATPTFGSHYHRLAQLGGGLMQGLLHDSNLAPLGGEVKP